MLEHKKNTHLVVSPPVANNYGKLLLDAKAEEHMTYSIIGSLGEIGQDIEITASTRDISFMI